MGSRKNIFVIAFAALNLLPALAMGQEVNRVPSGLDKPTLLPKPIFTSVADPVSVRKAPEKLSLLPVPAPETPPVTVKDIKVAAQSAHDLDLVEAREVIPGLDIFAKSLDPKKANAEEIVLNGTIYQKCFEHFEIVSADVDALVQDMDAKKRPLGFRISDRDGEGVACQKGMRGTPCKRGDSKAPDSCVSLASRFRMNLTNAESGQIKLYRIDERLDKDALQGDLLGGEHISAADLVKKQEQEIADAKTRKIEDLKNCVNNCRGSMEALNRARSSALQLSRMNELDGALADFNKKMDLEELALIESKISSASKDDLITLREDLNKWASRHPEHAERAVAAYRKIAKKTIPAKNAKASDYDDAAAVLSEAQEITGIKDATVESLDNDQNDIAVSRMKVIAMNGIQSNMAFTPNFMALSQQLQARVSTACYGGGAQGWGQEQSASSRSMESCTSAMQAYQSLNQMVQVGRQADQARAQMQQQMQQMLQGQQGQPMQQQPQFGLGANTSLYPQPQQQQYTYPNQVGGNYNYNMPGASTVGTPGMQMPAMSGNPYFNR